MKQPASYPPANANAVAHPAPRRKRSLIGDIWVGAVVGDFAHEIGLAGVITQVICSFTPGVGTVCAVRDVFADLRKHDWLGVTLNAFALVPIAGGISKTLDVLRSGAHIGHAVYVTSHAGKQR